ncbi:MAG: hypoxanthine phosphoribosyltransferase [Clostridiales bacterium]|nr:hypoxanthine phosphoribosyltransferase [Clostridiales bacterium]MBR4818827.1 hypoxanthine phosphoribosyltransferase [Clostridiales bacterium]MBR5058765.1 hypoxanthine phosphoribosyltransferase [Clostridiales bacterium]
MEEIRYKKILFDNTQILARVDELGKQINKDYAGKELVILGVLKGSLFFFTDLARAIDIPLQLDMIAIGNIPDMTKSTGIVRITKDVDVNITGKHVIVIEDIIRTGLTTAYLLQTLEARKPASIEVCTLLYNPERQLIDLPVKYYGFEVDRSWLIGYGMDSGEYGRNLPFIAELDH